MRKARAEEARRQRALAKEKARQESRQQAVLRVDVDDEDGNSDAAPVSPVRTQPDDESDMSEDDVQPSPSDARVGANLR